MTTTGISLAPGANSERNVCQSRGWRASPEIDPYDTRKIPSKVEKSVWFIVVSFDMFSLRKLFSPRRLRTFRRGFTRMNADQSPKANPLPLIHADEPGSKPKGKPFAADSR